MKLDNFTVIRRVPVEQYGHREIAGNFSVESGEDATAAVVEATQFIEKAAKRELEAQGALKPLPEAAPVEEAPVEEKKTTKKATTKKTTKKAPAKKKEPKTTPYNRDDKAHKEEFSRILDDNYEGWRLTKQSNPDFYAKITGTSAAMVGKPMFDAKNEVLTSFIDEITDTVGEMPSDDL